ncbi:hypothetical protein HYV74_02680 [Candidatus Uhrbacteria bacterium]|nr:hypothetical protein [Candidatus Uhrbacteria bacterium]
MPSAFESASLHPESESEIIRRTVEYRDAHGTLQCTAELEYERKDRPVAEMVERKTGDNTKSEQIAWGRAQRVRSLVLVRPGTSERVDLLAMANPHKVPVYQVTERLGNYWYDLLGKEVVVPPLETPVDIATLLHELGHADQYQDPRLQELVISARWDQPKIPSLNHVNHARDVRATLAALPSTLVGELPDAAALDAVEAAVQREDDYQKEMRAEENQMEQQVRRATRMLQAIATRELFSPEARDAMVHRWEATEEQERQRFQGDDAGWWEFQQEDLGWWQFKQSIVADLELSGFVFAESLGKEGALQTDRSPLSRESIGSVDDARQLLRTLTMLSTLNATHERRDGKIWIQYTMPGFVQFMGVMIRLCVGDDPQYQDLVREQAAAEAKMEDWDRREPERKAKLEMLREDFATQWRAAKLDHLLELPTRIKERDATRRAFQWMREIRTEHGIDLTAPVIVTEDALTRALESKCTAGLSQAHGESPESTADGGVILSAVQRLRLALGTYDADISPRRQLRQRSAPDVPPAE